MCVSTLISLLGSSARADAPVKRSKIDYSNLKLVWRDEFDGNTLDTTKWQAPEMPRQGGSRWQSSLVTVKDGMLHLGIRLTDDPVLKYDCGAIRTQKDYDVNQTMFWQRYGYFEARCRLPKNLKADYWASFWLLCGKIGTEQPDTRQGLEVDIFETFHLANSNSIEMAFHWNGYAEKHNVAGVAGDLTPQLRDNKFHTFGLYWDEKVYVLFVDGKEVCRTDLIGLGKGDNGKTKSKGPCQKPGYVKLTCEAAPWAGGTNEWEKELSKEDEMTVDYVRVYTGTLPGFAGAAVFAK